MVNPIGPSNTLTGGVTPSQDAQADGVAFKDVAGGIARKDIPAGLLTQSPTGKPPPASSPLHIAALPPQSAAAGKQAEANPAGGNNAKNAAGAERELQIKSFAELGVEIAAAHLTAVNANPRHTQAGLKDAGDQLAAARAGEMPLDFTDADLTAGVNALKRRYQGGGFDGYFGKIAEALKVSRGAGAPARLDFTDADLAAGANAMKRRYQGGGLDGYFGKIGDALKACRGAVAPARQEIAAALKGLTANERTEAGNDPIIAALIKAFKLPDPGPMSFYERTYKHADPLGFALLLKAGIRIQMGAANTVAVTRGGKPLQLTQEELEMAGEKNISGLAGSLLKRTPPDAGTCALRDAAVEARRTYTRTEVERLHPAGTAGTVEGDKQALATLGCMMRGALSPDEANFLWAQYGEPVFTPGYFDRRVDEFLAGHRKANAFLTGNPKEPPFAVSAGEWISKNFGDMPPEAAGRLADSIIAKFDVTWVTTPSAPPLGIGGFYSEFSRLVGQSQNPDRAARAAKWYTSVPGRENAFLYNDGAFSTQFRFSAGKGDSAALSAAIAARAEEFANKGGPGGAYEEISNKVADALKSAEEEGQQVLNRNAAGQMYELFNADPGGVLKPIFEGLHTPPNLDVTKPRQFDGNGIPLENMIGRAMGMSAVDREAAAKGDNTKKWYTAPGQQAAIAGIVRWIKEQGGARPTVSATPLVFADKRQGVVNFALFHTAGVTLDGSIAQFVAGKPPGTKPNQQYIYRDGRAGYADLDHYRKNNLLPVTGTLYAPASTVPGPDGKTRLYDAMPAHVHTGRETATEVLDIGVGAAALVGALFTDGLSLALLNGGAFAYGAGRTGYNIYAMQRGGQSMSLANPEARANYLTGLTTVLDLGVTTAGAKAGQALRAASLATSGVMTAQQLHALGTHWDDMSGPQRAMAALRLGLGGAGLIRGARNPSHPNAPIASRPRGPTPGPGLEPASAGTHTPPPEGTIASPPLKPGPEAAVADAGAGAGPAATVSIPPGEPAAPPAAPQQSPLPASVSPEASAALKPEQPEAGARVDRSGRSVGDKPESNKISGTDGETQRARGAENESTAGNAGAKPENVSASPQALLGELEQRFEVLVSVDQHRTAGKGTSMATWGLGGCIGGYIDNQNTNTIFHYTNSFLPVLESLVRQQVTATTRRVHFIVPGEWHQNEFQPDADYVERLGPITSYIRSKGVEVVFHPYNDKLVSPPPAVGDPRYQGTAWIGEEGNLFVEGIRWNSR